MDLKNILKSYFAVQKDKTIPKREKSKLLRELAQGSQEFSRSELKNVAAMETLSDKGEMYKLFCQYVALTGRISNIV